MEQVYRPRWNAHMNKQFGRLLLAGVCGLIVASAATAEDPPRQSHRIFENDFGDLSQAQSLLARRLRHTEDIRNLQELAKELKAANPEQLKQLQDVIKNHPEFLDDDRLHDIINAAKEYKQNGGIGLSPETTDKLTKEAKKFLDKQKSQETSSENPLTGGSPNGTHPFDNQTPIPKPPPVVPKGETPPQTMEQHVEDLLKKLTNSAEGKALQKAALNDLAKTDAEWAKSSPAFADFLEKVISPKQANWLSHNLKLPELPNFGGLATPTSGASGLGGASPGGGGLEAGVWVIALALFGVAGWLALRAAKWQTARGAGVWSAGPWPVHPSRVFTREDLIRAFEHLALLRLGLRARPLNHLDLAGRLGDTGDRAEPAARLAHLYEQARYAPGDELLPPDELAAARGDLSTLAGAAA
jgi:hypothetical protein